MNGENVRMVEPRSHPRLALKDPAGRRVRQIVEQTLDRDRMFEPDIEGAIDHAHVAFTDRFLNVINQRALHSQDNREPERLGGRAPYAKTFEGIYSYVMTTTLGAAFIANTNTKDVLFCTSTDGTNRPNNPPINRFPITAPSDFFPPSPQPLPRPIPGIAPPRMLARNCRAFAIAMQPPPDDGTATYQDL